MPFALVETDIPEPTFRIAATGVGYRLRECYAGEDIWYELDLLPDASAASLAAGAACVPPPFRCKSSDVMDLVEGTLVTLYFEKDL